MKLHYICNCFRLSQSRLETRKTSFENFLTMTQKLLSYAYQNPGLGILNKELKDTQNDNSNEIWTLMKYGLS